MRIAVGGVQHETNTFAATQAGWDDFVAADAWPGLTRGPAIFDAVRGINLPIAGFIDAARSDRHELVPLSWCAAQPSGPVTRDAYERISALLLDDLRAHAPLDAVYLDLHGAMVAEHALDGDGELLRRVRSLVGERVPVAASLDFHANVSAQMLAQADVLVNYRSYPHVDMAETGARAALQLARGAAQRASGAPALNCAHEPLDFLIPLVWQSTLVEPMRTLMARLPDGVEFAPGFALADVAEAGPCVYGYGDATMARRAAAFAAEVAAAEPAFAGRLWDIGAAVVHVADGAARGLMILADTQDNPGAGGNGDTTSLVKALLAAQVPDVVAGVWCDPAAAAAAHAAGAGARVVLRVGAGSRFAEESPIEDEFVVEGLGDGRFTGTGPFYRGARMALGPMACLRTGGGLRIVVASRKQQAADQAMFRHVGVEPAGARVLVLKSSVHFRADFGPLASEVLVVAAPGPSPADTADLPYRRLRPGVRRACQRG